ncbi:hypothetical protein [Flavobacterium sp. NKUCC04_CG]|uniref:hypothetical protein n=1 Tax=Flavobacterium sp. NKUCC04_CG TaxID=2842121 RepID=UPI001C5B335C|nr:hypothetical protein [Flavobacterium sp. NKUCC04_CG]MBW3520168.1 hypothetical protein [Flavobacterium sp. NKUCC04_CG]
MIFYKKLVLICLIFFVSCRELRYDKGIDDSSIYLITKIKSKNDWHIIYAVKRDSVYKIISHKEKLITDRCVKIAVGNYYNLKLDSKRENTVLSTGERITPVNFTGCFEYDGETIICLEPERKIYDLHNIKKLKGLYLCE